jgi:hypothetical protein
MNTCEGCKCYARSESLYPDRHQFCGKQIGDKVYRFPDRCCVGGCPGPGKTPYRIVDVRDIYRTPPPYIKIILLLLIALSTLFMA